MEEFLDNQNMLISSSMVFKTEKIEKSDHQGSTQAWCSGAELQYSPVAPRRILTLAAYRADCWKAADCMCPSITYFSGHDSVRAVQLLLVVYVQFAMAAIRPSAPSFVTAGRCRRSFTAAGTPRPSLAAVVRHHWETFAAVVRLTDTLATACRRWAIHQWLHRPVLPLSIPCSRSRFDNRCVGWPTNGPVERAMDGGWRGERAARGSHWSRQGVGRSSVMLCACVCPCLYARELHMPEWLFPFIDFLIRRAIVSWV